MLRNRVYYRIKPFIPQSLRTAVRRRFASRLRGGVANIWPIMPGSERPPENWPGWPEGKKFALVLTHDVESATGLQKCRELMRIDMEFGFRSSFNFVPEGDYRVPRELREELTQNGFEVGIHDLKHDGRLYQSRREFSQRATRINRYLAEWRAAGFRSAFMLHELDWLHELDIRYDASTFDTDPFEPQPEGRHSIFPLWIPRPVAQPPAHRGLRPGGRSEVRGRRSEVGGQRSEVGGQRSDRLTTSETLNSLNPQPSTLNPSRSGYVELPYTLPQDSTLFLLLGEKTPDIWLRKLDWIAEHGGMALVITHPDYMAFGAAQAKSGEYPVKLYEQFLRYLRSQYPQDYWRALPKEVAAHVTAHREKARAAERDGHHPLLSIETAAGRRPVDGSGVPSRILENRWRLRGKRAAVLLFSYYPADPRPLRAAEALAAEGVTIDLFCLQQSPADPKREKINGVNVFRSPLRRRRGGKAQYIRQYTTFIARAFATLAGRSFRRRYDLVHVHNMPDALVFSALVPKLLGAKVILDLHDPMPELMQSIFNLSKETVSVRLLKKLEKWSISFADAVLTVNLACKKIYSGRSCPPEKITVVMNTPDEGVFPLLPAGATSRNNGDPARPFTILYHGSLVQRNGFDLAVDAVDRIRKSIPGAQLLVCGERTTFFDEVMDSAAKKGMDDAVRYLGMKNRRGIVEAIGNCDVGIIPNHRNLFTEINTPTRIFEYLSLGKPVIAPKAAGILDYFGDDDLIFFELGNHDDLARKIEYVYFHPIEVQEIVRRGQEVYLAHQWKAEKLNLLHVASELV